MKRYATLLLIPLLGLGMTLTTGCGGSNAPSPQTIKLIFTTATTTFEAAMIIAAPNWNSGKYVADVNAVVAAWQVGANWKQNVANVLLPAVIADAKDIPGCTGKCPALVQVFTSGAQSVIAELLAPKTAGVKAPYKTYEAYRADWNAVAPADAQLAEGF